MTQETTQEVDVRSTLSATMMLADHAQVADGKLNLIGGGWTLTGPDPCPFALAGWVHIPWARANEKLHVVIDLVDADGRPVTFEVMDGEPQQLTLDSLVEVGRPVGVPAGVVQDMPFAFNMAPLPLAPGGSFEWRLAIDDKVLVRRAFTVRQAQHVGV